LVPLIISAVMSMRWDSKMVEDDQNENKIFKLGSIFESKSR